MPRASDLRRFIKTIVRKAKYDREHMLFIVVFHLWLSICVAMTNNQFFTLVVISNFYNEDTILPVIPWCNREKQTLR